jgi:hypothetical protein
MGYRRIHGELAVHLSHWFLASIHRVNRDSPGRVNAKGAL